jgi:magnesium-transporting ATPase (P-type)
MPALGALNEIRTGGLKAEPPVSAVIVSQDKSKVTGLSQLGIQVTAEAPNGSIHRFNGSVDFSFSLENVRSSLCEKHLLLRGSVLRATEWCLCLVTYTGRDSKLSLNSKGTPSKLSSVDRVVNRTLLIAMIVMLIVCGVSMLSNIIWTSMNSDADYLCLFSSDLDGEFTCANSAPNSVLSVFTFATLYNNVSDSCHACVDACTDPVITLY